MELTKFIKKFASLFDETETEVFSPQTQFKNLAEWSSLIALAVIAMIDDEYNVTIKGNDIRNAVTIEDLFKVVKALK